jgi:tetratricopeptide (TPR) repeat protein
MLQRPVFGSRYLLTTLFGVGAVLVLFAHGAASQQRQEPAPQPSPRSEPPKSEGQPKAQQQRRPPPGARGAAPMPKALPAEKYTGPAERDRLLSDLYAQLAAAADEKEAAQHANAIERLWQAGTSDSARVLIERAGVALAAKDNALALDLLNEAVRLSPDQSEPWVRRAYFNMADNNAWAAIGDLRRAIALEPNHFQALSALANALREVREYNGALKIARQVLEIHPFMDGVKNVIDDLSRRVEGQGT